MPLSIDKLKKLLKRKNFIIHKYYKVHEYCAFIEILYTLTSDKYMMYIPSKYQFKLSGTSAYKMKSISMNENDEDMTEKYTGAGSVDDMESMYNEIDIQNDYTDKDMDTIESKLEDNYKTSITLMDLEKGDNYDVKSIYRQIRRLKYSVQNLRYKLCIQYKKYMCVIHRDDDIDTYYISNFPVGKMPEKNFLVVFDLNVFYDNIDTIVGDLSQVSRGINKILDKNQLRHIKDIELLNSKGVQITSNITRIARLRMNISKRITEYQTLLEKIIENEKSIYTQLYRIENGQGGGIGSDMNSLHTKNKLYKDIEKIHGIKEELMSNISRLQIKESDIVLKIDNILFDNTMMLNRIFKNINELNNIE